MNSIRVRLNQLEAVIKKHNPAIIGLQETKVTDEDFPVEEINDLGYDVAFHGQKTHYGVALLYRSEATEIRKGFITDNEESQKRLIRASFTTKDGRPLSFRAGPYDEIGLFGSTVTFLRTEESLLPLTDGAIPLMDLTEVSTPPTPPMTD